MGVLVLSAKAAQRAAPLWQRLLMLIALLLPLAPAASAADVAGDLERQVKAAMLYKFLGYIEWPPEAFSSPESPYVIAVAGAADMVSELRTITRDRVVNQRPIVVRQVGTKSDLSNVHLLFVGARSGSAQQNRLMQKAKTHNLLTVTEKHDGLGNGSVINFRLVGDRIGFDVSLVNAGARRLKMSSRLLAVASHVETGEL